MKRISELPTFNVNESGFKEMAVTIPISNSHEETRRVHIGEHCYLNEDDAIDRIRDIYRSGMVPFILPVKL